MRCIKFNYFILLLVTLTFCGCEKDIPYTAAPLNIIGHWRAESYNFDGLRVPLSPDLEFQQQALFLISGSDRQEVGVASIEAVGDTIVVNVNNGFGFTFHMLSENRMYFQIPAIGTKIYYRKQVEYKQNQT